MSVDNAPGEKRGTKWIWLILLIAAFALIVIWLMNPAGEADPEAMADGEVPAAATAEERVETLEEYPVTEDGEATETAPEDFPQ